MLVPASGGTEKPFTVKGRRLQYMWNTEANDQNGEQDHVYLDLDTDIVLTDEEVSDLFLN